MSESAALVLDVAATGFVVASGAFLATTLLVGWLRRRRQGRRRDQT